MSRSGGRAVVLGAGSTGEAFASALRRHEPDVPITVVERELVGGECSYYACMPTKALLRPGEALAAARNVPGAAEAVVGVLDADRVFWHRDQVTSGWDDSSDLAVTMNSTPVVLDRATTDEKGRLERTYTVPLDAPSGAHHIEVAGTFKGEHHAISLPLTVVVRATPRFTG